MPTSAAGNRRPAPRPHGFTLLELLVVIAIIAVATAGVSLALRDSAQARLEREAERLAVLFESARAQSRALGVPVRWMPRAGGFVFDGLPDNALPQQWLDAATLARSAAPILLGPEPMLPAQAVSLWHAAQPAQQLRVASDGLHPFRVSQGPEVGP